MLTSPDMLSRTPSNSWSLYLTVNGCGSLACSCCMICTAVSVAFGPLLTTASSLSASAAAGASALASGIEASAPAAPSACFFSCCFLNASRRRMAASSARFFSRMRSTCRSLALMAICTLSELHASSQRKRSSDSRSSRDSFDGSFSPSASWSFWYTSCTQPCRISIRTSSGHDDSLMSCQQLYVMLSFDLALRLGPGARVRSTTSSLSFSVSASSLSCLSCLSCSDGSSSRIHLVRTAILVSHLATS
mmetsp:Transcript_41901/g.102748  ORF Transcript_41901/g.102748 Transcript_41901/m.102748 type:complete len:248 (-) Transcript_41901:1056-1799(-)